MEPTGRSSGDLLHDFSRRAPRPAGGGWRKVGRMNTTTATSTHPVTRPPDHDWREAGDAWGRRANDWACLYEQYASEVLAAMHHRIGTGPGVRHLDIACGAGGALRYVEA